MARMVGLAARLISVMLALTVCVLGWLAGWLAGWLGGYVVECGLAELSGLAGLGWAKFG